MSNVGAMSAAELNRMYFVVNTVTLSIPYGYDDARAI
jgi:hypothetical protein